MKETGLYIHVPFCIKKCNYCDFVSYPYREEAVGAYLKGLEREMKLYAGEPSFQERQISTLYIGGGTPTCLPSFSLGKIIQDSFKYFNLQSGAEVSVEANPGTFSNELLQVLLLAGVNRLSLGVQSSLDDELHLLGRIHDFRQAEESFNSARAAGFNNIGVDLISGLPGQSVSQWKKTLEAVLALEPDHVSAYGLQLERGTPLHRDVSRGKIAPCSEEEDLKMFWETINFLTGHGFEHYEISNFARPGRQCKHNLIYWRNQEYIGLGPAAHSYIGGCRYENKRAIKLYREAVDAGRFPIARREPVDIRTEMSETVFMGLRLMNGLDLTGFEKRFGCSFNDAYGFQVELLTKAGLLELTGDRLRLTPRGLPVANRVFMEFL